MKRSGILLIAFLLLILVTAGYAGCAGQENGVNNNGAVELEERVSDEEAPRVGSRAPVFALHDLDGESHSLKNYEGRPVVIKFWTTWSPYCVAEMPLLQELHESEKKVVVLTVNVQETKEDVEAFNSAEGYSFPVLLDERGKVSASYQVRGLPTTFAVSGQGIITAIRVGAFDADGLAALVESTEK